MFKNTEMLARNYGGVLRTALQSSYQAGKQRFPHKNQLMTVVEKAVRIT